MHATLPHGSLLSKDVLDHFKIERLRGTNTGISVPLMANDGRNIAELKFKTSLPLNVIDIKCAVNTDSTSQTDLLPIYHLYGIPGRSNYIIITFGIAEVWMLWKYGFPHVIAILSPDVIAHHADIVSKVLKKNGVLWILTDARGHSFKKGDKSLQLFSTRRTTRHIFPKYGRVLDLSPVEIQALFLQ